MLRDGAMTYEEALAKVQADFAVGCASGTARRCHHKAALDLSVIVLATVWGKDSTTELQKANGWEFAETVAASHAGKELVNVA